MKLTKTQYRGVRNELVLTEDCNSIEAKTSTRWYNSLQELKKFHDVERFEAIEEREIESDELKAAIKKVAFESMKKGVIMSYEAAKVKVLSQLEKVQIKTKSGHLTNTNKTAIKRIIKAGQLLTPCKVGSIAYIIKPVHNHSNLFEVETRNGKERGYKSKFSII